MVNTYRNCRLTAEGWRFLSLVFSQALGLRFLQMPSCASQFPYELAGQAFTSMLPESLFLRVSPCSSSSSSSCLSAGQLTSSFATSSPQSVLASCASSNSSRSLNPSSFPGTADSLQSWNPKLERRITPANFSRKPSRKPATPDPEARTPNRKP